MANRDNEQGIPEPVSPELYTREYFTTDCEGRHLFLEGTAEIPERIQEALEAAGDLAGKWVLDLGCGRGELTCEAAARGAHAVGIDYSQAALELAQALLDTLDPEPRDRVEFVASDAKGLPFPDGSFDVVFMVDVYEHLHPHEIESTLAEIKRVLRPRGKLIVHTGPNTWFYRYGYPLVRETARLLLRRELPEDLRGQYDDIMHVNEQSPLSLRHGLRQAGFKAAVRPRSFFVGMNPNRWERAVMRILFTRPAAYIFCTSLMAEARPEEGGREAQLRVNRVLRMMAPPRGSRVLLLGESEGMLAHRLSHLAEVDVTWMEPGKESAAGQAASPHQGGYTRKQGDLYALPFADSHFDAAAAQFTLEYLESPERAIAEWSRVIKEGGLLVLVVHNGLFKGWEQRPGPRPLNSFTPGVLVRLVEDAGLIVEETSTLIPDLRFPALYRGDLDFSLTLERLPFLSKKGSLLFLRARKEGGR